MFRCWCFKLQYQWCNTNMIIALWQCQFGNMETSICKTSMEIRQCPYGNVNIANTIWQYQHDNINVAMLGWWHANMAISTWQYQYGTIYVAKSIRQKPLMTLLKLFLIKLFVSNNRETSSHIRGVPMTQFSCCWGTGSPVTLPIRMPLVSQRKNLFEHSWLRNNHVENKACCNAARRNL